MSDNKRDSNEETGEFALIRSVFAPLATSQAARGLSDDAAVISPPNGEELVVTVDTMTEGVHFRAEDGPESAAARILASNVSDLAAMAADPLGYVLAIAATGDQKIDWFRAFAGRLEEDQARYGMTLLGGDTTSTPGALTLTITAFGTVPAGQAVSRNGARPGDDLWVTGTIGDAWLGLKLLLGDVAGADDKSAKALQARFLYPEPRLDVRALVRGHATAALDISDGLIADVRHIAEESGVSIQIEQPNVPVSEMAQAILRRDAALSIGMVTGGDDYELAFTAPAQARELLQNSSTPVTRIGTVSDADHAPTVHLRDAGGVDIALEGGGGFEHFRA